MTGEYLECPRCPLCEHEPMFVLVGAIQAFCSNPECDLICWNPSVTLDENLTSALGAHTITGQTPSTGADQ